MTQRSEIASTISRSRVLANQPDFRVAPISTSAGSIYTRRFVLLRVSAPAAVAYAHELGARAADIASPIRSTSIRRMSSDKAERTLKNFESASLLSLMNSAPAERVVLLDHVCTSIEHRGSAIGLEFLLSSLIESAWPFCEGGLAQRAVNLWTRYVAESPLLKKRSLLVFDANTMSAEVFKPEDIRELDLDRKARERPYGKGMSGPGFRGGGMGGPGSGPWGGGMGRPGSAPWGGGMGGPGSGTWGGGMGGPGSGPWGGGMGGPGSGPWGGGMGGPGGGSDFPGGGSGFPGGAGGSSGAGAPQLGGPFGRGRSPGEQRTDSHDWVSIGNNIAAAGAALFIGGGAVAATGAASTAPSGGLGGIVAIGGAVGMAAGAIVFGIGLGIATAAADKTKDKPAEATPTSSLGEGMEEVPLIEDEQGGDDAVAWTDTEGELGKPDPNSTTGKPDPNAWYPAPDDVGGGGPNSRAAGFPSSRDFYPSPDGDGVVGPRAAGAHLVSIAIGVGPGVASTIRAFGPQSFKIVG